MTDHKDHRLTPTHRDRLLVPRSERSTTAIITQAAAGRRAISATCALHRGPRGFTTLMVSKRDGTIMLDPHIDGSYVISLDQDGATALCDTLTEWLG
jgi:hypothetical protein